MNQDFVTTKPHYAALVASYVIQSYFIYQMFIWRVDRFWFFVHLGWGVQGRIIEVKCVFKVDF